MMSNSTLPLGFLHLIQNWSRVASSVYLDIAFAVEFFLVGSAGCRDEVNQLHHSKELVIYSHAGNMMLPPWEQNIPTLGIRREVTACR